MRDGWLRVTLIRKQALRNPQSLDLALNAFYFSFLLSDYLDDILHLSAVGDMVSTHIEYSINTAIFDVNSCCKQIAELAFVLGT